jgi:hypothetical protein
MRLIRYCTDVIGPLLVGKNIEIWFWVSFRHLDFSGSDCFLM